MFRYLYPLIALSVVHIGNDNSITELMRIPSYYTDLLLAFGCTYGIGFYFRKFFHRVNDRFNWDTEVRSILIHQLTRGLLLPLLFILLIEIGYLLLIDIPLAESSILYLELPVIFTFLSVINLLYFILYYQSHHQGLKYILDQQEKEKEAEGKGFFVAGKGDQKLNISNQEVAYFFIRNKVTWLVTKEGNRYLYDFAMKELIQQLGSNTFFQLNRQVIASRSSIVKSVPTETRRLSIHLQPPLDEDIFLPKTKATEFLSWLNRS